MLEEGVATERFTQMLVGGMVRERKVIGLDSFARVHLGRRFHFDRDDAGAGPFAATPRGVRLFDADYTVTDDDHGQLLVARGAVNFTLPTKANGLVFRFLQTADARMKVLGSSDLVYGGTAGGSTLDFNTASQKLGSQVLVECLYVLPNTLAWVVTNGGGTTLTIS
jgi:hypothetical protein